MRLPSVFERYRREVETELRAMVGDQNSVTYDMMRYHLGWVDEKGRPVAGTGGKKLRSTLCLLACEATGADFREALPAAAAIELVHNFSLIHDDVQDGDKERRHRPTVWSIWGKSQAVNAGTAMHVLAHLSLMRLAQNNIPIQKVLRAQRLLYEACLRMIDGQQKDISYENLPDVDVNDYLDMIDGKTAALIACSLELGALLGTDDEPVVDGFRRIGKNLGLAFQIMDDILGIWGDSRQTGKPETSDILRRKKSLPVIYALQKTTGPAKAELQDIYSQEAMDSDGADKVLRILDGLRAKAYAQSMAEQYRDRALAEIDKMVLSSWARSTLWEMAYFLANRRF